MLVAGEGCGLRGTTCTAPTKDPYDTHCSCFHPHAPLTHHDPPLPQIVAALAPQIVAMSMHKFASNVVEKCLTHCGVAERDTLLKAMLGSATSAHHSGGGASEGGPGGLESGEAGDGPAGGSASGGSDGGAGPGGLEGAGPEGGASGEGAPHGPHAGEDPLQAMMKDQYGNYVVQRVLEVGAD